jgi:hypothetical protein
MSVDNCLTVLDRLQTIDTRIGELYVCNRDHEESKKEHGKENDDSESDEDTVSDENEGRLY